MSTYENPEQSLTDIVTYHKLHPLCESIGQLTYEIDKRRELMDRNVKVIQYRECELGTMKLQLYNELPIFAVIDNRTRQTIEKSLTDLRLEISNEYKQYWKDVIRLKQDLQEKLNDYDNSKALLGKGLLPQAHAQGGMTSADSSVQQAEELPYSASAELIRAALERLP